VAIPQSDNFPNPGIVVTIGIIDSFLNVGHTVVGQLAEEKPNLTAPNFDSIDAIFTSGTMLRPVGLFVITDPLGKVVAFVTPLIAGIGRGFALTG
jgi:hypothetical protein